MFKPQAYVELSEEEIKAEYNNIITYWEKFLLQRDLKLKPNVDYFIHKRNLFEIIRRCDKRRAYYNMFHNLENICEYKYIAIKCFWINTIKPFMVVNDKVPIYSCPNEMFSLFLIMSVIRDEFERVYPDKNFEFPNPKRIQDIVYDFKYCSFNREAMISFVETFADNYGVGINYILGDKL